MLRHQRDTDADVFLRVPSDHIPLPLPLVLGQHRPAAPRSPPLCPLTLPRLHNLYLVTTAILVLQDGEGNYQTD